MTTHATGLTTSKASRLIFAVLVCILAAAMLASPAAHGQADKLAFTIDAPGVQTSQVTCPGGLAVENFDSAPVGATTAYSSPALGEYAAVTGQPFIILAADVFGGAGGAGNYIASDTGEAYVLTLAQPAGYFGFWWSAGNGNNEVTVNLADGTSQTFSTQAIMDAPGLVSGPPPAGHFGNPNPGYGEGEVYAFVNIFATDPSAKITSFTFSEKPGGVGRFESDNHTVCPDILDPSTGSPVPQTGTIIIKKNTVPQFVLLDFSFSDDIVPPNSFALPGGGMRTFEGVPISEYTVTEGDPSAVGSGFYLSDLICEDSVATGQASTTDLGTRTATVKLEMGETVTCTFTNTQVQPLAVTKTAETSFTRTWSWTVDKAGDQTALTLAAGQQFLANYDVTVDATPSDHAWAVQGTITTNNPNQVAASITGVADEIGGVGAAAVVCPVTFPYELAAGGTLECTYSASLPDGADRVNTAMVTTSGLVPGGSDTADVVFGDPTSEVDECIEVSDDKTGVLGTACADAAPQTFEYSLYVGPYNVCGDHTFTNVASFVTNDSGATGSDSWDVRVNVPCDGCTRTPGYWKTHSSYGPTPYDDTWALLPNGADTPFFLSGQSYHQVLWTAPGGNAYYILAHAYIAAQLNQLNGADFTAAQAAFDQATVLFQTYTPAEIGALKGNKPLRKQFISLAETLDQYNNGTIGPGHCSE